MKLIVAKFGGTSMGTAEAIKKTAAIIQENAKRKVVVVSAMSGITNLLIQMGELAKTG